MRTALCTLNNQIYVASDFHHPENYANRWHLVCTECNEPATYRRQGRDGREACFFATHAEGCAMAALGHDPENQANTDQEVNTVTGRRIIVDFSNGAVATGTATRPTEGGIAPGMERGRPTGGIGQREYVTRRLSTLLNLLREGEEFARSTETITIPGIGDFAIADFFADFANVTEEHIGRYHGYWGRISYSRRIGNSQWFNTGGPGTMSILLDARYFEETDQRFGIEHLDDLTGSYLLVFGELRRALSNGKLLVQITDPGHFTLSLT